jgi:nucleotide-binding universal stress UspA family protein
VTNELLSNVLVPVASAEDAESTCEALLPRLTPGEGSVTVIHVVEKAGGAPDEASVEQREEYAQAALDVVERRCEAAGVAVETCVVYGTDVADAILSHRSFEEMFDAARTHDADMVVMGWGDDAHGSPGRAESAIDELPTTFPVISSC